MKIALVFVISFKFKPNEKNVLEYILSQYAKYIHAQTKGKTKGKADQGDITKVNNKLIAIFKLLQENKINPDATVNDINPELDKEIANILEINNELDDVYIFDEMVPQNKAIIHYQLFNQKFQLLIQYSGQMSKIYFNNVIKCVKCYIQDGKAWTVLVMKHDFGDIQENKVLGVLDTEQIFTVEYNDSLEDKKIRDNDMRYDGYLWQAHNEVNTLFATEVEQMGVIKERPSTGKSKKDTKIHLSEPAKTFDTWDMPHNAHILTGILDTEQKLKVINVVQSLHRDMKSTKPMKGREKLGLEQFKYEDKINGKGKEKNEEETKGKGKDKNEEETRGKGKDKNELDTKGIGKDKNELETKGKGKGKKEEETKGKGKEETKGKGKDKKKKSNIVEKVVEDVKDKVELKINGTNLFSDSPSSSWFHNTSTPQGHTIGLLLKAKDPLTPELTEKLQPLTIKLGNLKSLPMKILNQYGVTRIHANIEFEQPLKNMKTIPQFISKDVSFNFFKMAPLMNIKNHQQFFSAFYLKHMTIQLIGEIDKDVEEEQTEVEEIPEEIEVLKVQEEEIVKKSVAKKGKDKKRRKTRTINKESRHEEEEKIEMLEEDIEVEKIVPNKNEEDWFDSDASDECLLTYLDDDEFKEDDTPMIPENTIISETQNVFLVRICLFRVNLTSLLRYNSFNNIQEKLTPSSIYDKERVNNGHTLEDREERQYNGLEEHVYQSKSENESNNTQGKTIARQRGYLFGVDYNRNVTLDFECQIYAPFKKLCKELYRPDDNSMNNVFILSQDKVILNKLVRHIQKYNLSSRTLKSDTSITSNTDNRITGFFIQFSDVGIMFAEGTISTSFPLLVKWVLKFCTSLKIIIYNTTLIIPYRIYSELLDYNQGMFTHENRTNFRDAFRSNKSSEVYEALFELIHVSSIENIHKYQLLPDISQLNSLHEKARTSEISE